MENRTEIASLGEFGLIEHLTLEQEKEIVSDRKLFLVAVWADDNQPARAQLKGIGYDDEARASLLDVANVAPARGASSGSLESRSPPRRRFREDADPAVRLGDRALSLPRDRPGRQPTPSATATARTRSGCARPATAGNPDDEPDQTSGRDDRRPHEAGKQEDQVEQGLLPFADRALAQVIHLRLDAHAAELVAAGLITQEQADLLLADDASQWMGFGGMHGMIGCACTSDQRCVSFSGT